MQFFNRNTHCQGRVVTTQTFFSFRRWCSGCRRRVWSLMINVVQRWWGYRPRQVSTGPNTSRRDAIKREPTQIEVPQQRNSTYNGMTIELHIYCNVCFFPTCLCCVQVGDPMSYHRESWMMEKDEKLQTVPLLHMQGNTLVKQRQYREAASKYKEAVLLLKTVQSRVSEDRSTAGQN